MSRDIKLIKLLESKLKKKLEPTEHHLFEAFDRGYMIDKNDQIIGLNLNNVGKFDISILRKFKMLSYLKLSNNYISDISVLSHLERLTFLDLSNNLISDIWPLKDLKNLNYLNLRNNKITHLPFDFFYLEPKIKWEESFGFSGIILSGNPIVRPPIEILEKGKEAVKAYFKSLEGEKRALKEVKLLIVGDGGAGKTSLVKRFLRRGFDIRESQTHGIDIKHCRIKNKHDSIRVNVWDFGGQEIMHATHQFFLSRRSLYILVLDGRKDEKTEYWLNLIQSFGGDSPVLVVINKIDQTPSFDVNRKFLREKYPNIRDFFKISCMTKEGINEFSKNLINELSKVELIQSVWALNWFNVKKTLETITNNYISYNKYKKICEKYNVIDTSTQNFLIDYLHDLGVILHFRDFDLQDTHVLNPRWVTNGVYKIINSMQLVEGKGVLELSHLEEILKPIDEGNYVYQRDKFAYIVNLMVKFELCFKIGSTKILVPDLLQVQEPDFIFEHQSSLKFNILYEYLPRSIIPRFIVRMNHDIKSGLSWRTGVMLECNAIKTTALVKADEREKTIFVYINGSRKRNYFLVLLHTFRQINQSFEKLEYIEKIPMPDNPKISVSYRHLLWLEDHGFDQYAPDGATKVYNIKELLGTIQKDTYKQLLTKLKKEFLAIKKLRPQKRGIEFEKFLNRLFQMSDLNPMNSFMNIGEQIDGSFQIGNEIYLVEAKWQKNKTAFKDLSVFDGKVSRKAKWTRGLFISISGFTDEGKNAISKGKSISIIGMDSTDLEYLLNSEITLKDAISWKSRYAAETNNFYAPITELLKRYS